MKKRILKPNSIKLKIIVLLLTIASTTFNSCENTIEEIETLPSFQVAALDILPVSVQAEVTTTENSLKSVLVHKDNIPFGTVISTRIHQRNKSDGSVSYTLGLTRNAEELYYDNLVVNRGDNGHLKTHIVRYQPEASWFYQHKTEGLDYDTYSGSITIFDETGTLLSSVALVSGIPVKEVEKSVSSKTNTADNCEVLDVEYVGGCAGEDYCWWNEIIITVECTGTGGGDPCADDGMNDGFDNTGGGGDDGVDTGTGGNTGDAPGETIDTVPVEEIGEELVVVSPDNPINDIEAYLECFDVTQDATLTIYADQPVVNSDDPYVKTNGEYIVGHAFVSITQGSNTSVFGFYPNGDPSPFFPGAPSILGNNQNDTYDVSVTVNISSAILSQVLQYAKNYNSTYNLNSYNCTDYAINIGNLAGLNLPDCYGSWALGLGGGSNPGALGQYIRNDVSTGGNVTTKDTNSGTAPANNKGC